MTRARPMGPIDVTPLFTASCLTIEIFITACPCCEGEVSTRTHVRVREGWVVECGWCGASWSVEGP